MSLFRASALALTIAIFAVGAVGVLGWAIFIRPVRSVTAVEHLTAYFELFKISLACVAAAGAAVGLVVAYRRQRTVEDTHDLNVRTENRIASGWMEDARRDRTRLFNERFTSASQQLGSERMAVRLAGVYAMAGLADDWKEKRQTCIDVLCGYFRMSSRADWSDEEVCNAVFRVIREHLASNAGTRWSGIIFNFRGAQFTGQDLSDLIINEEEKFDFREATVTGDGLSFARSNFIDGDVDFEDAIVSGTLNFTRAALRQDFTISLDGLKLDDNGRIHFNHVNLQDQGRINLGIHLSEGSSASLAGGRLHSGRVNFAGLHMKGGRLDMRVTTLGRNIIKWPDSLLGSGTIAVPEDDDIVDCLGISAHAGQSDGVVVQTEPWRR